MAFSMEVVDTAEIKQEVEQQAQTEPEEVRKLREQAERNADEIMSLDPDALDKRRETIAGVESFGQDGIVKSGQKNALLKVTVGDLAKTGGDGGVVSKSLIDLQREIKELDPGAIDFTKSGFLGKIFNPVRAYFEKYERSENVIANILESLDKGRSMLKNDNTTLEIEEQGLREITRRIAKEIEMGSFMDDAITRKIEEAKAGGQANPDKIRFAEEEILFPLRQRLMDMQQMVVVNQQGIIAMEVIRRNNLQLVRGVDRAKNVTVSALRTAVIVAGALYNQRIVLQKIQMLNETTDKLIGTTSRMLKEQGTEIQRQAMESTVSVETLKTAFADVISALDSISQFKQQALPAMRQTISQFRELADRGETEISKLERGSAVNLLE
jgi:uncharacterized protein YaaN involved in tellurite resistance